MCLASALDEPNAIPFASLSHTLAGRFSSRSKLFQARACSFFSASFKPEICHRRKTALYTSTPVGHGGRLGRRSSLFVRESRRKTERVSGQNSAYGSQRVMWRLDVRVGGKFSNADRVIEHSDDFTISSKICNVKKNPGSRPRITNRPMLYQQLHERSVPIANAIFESRHTVIRA